MFRDALFLDPPYVKNNMAPLMGVHNASEMGLYQKDVISPSRSVGDDVNMYCNYHTDYLSMFPD